MFTKCNGLRALQKPNRFAIHVSGEIPRANVAVNAGNIVGEAVKKSICYLWKTVAYGFSTSVQDVKWSNRKWDEDNQL